MGAIRDAVVGVERNRGGQPHRLKLFLSSIDPEDAADIVDLLRDPQTSTKALSVECAARLGFRADMTTWYRWSGQARDGNFDQWAS